MPMSTLSACQAEALCLGSFDAVLCRAAHRLGIKGLALAALSPDLAGQVGDVEVVMVLVVGVLGRCLVISKGFVLVVVFEVRGVVY